MVSDLAANVAIKGKLHFFTKAVSTEGHNDHQIIQKWLVHFSKSLLGLFSHLMRGHARITRIWTTKSTVCNDRFGLHELHHAHFSLSSLGNNRSDSPPSMPSNLVFRHTDRTSHHTLRVVSEPRPTITSGEVLVQVRGVTLNYRDTIIANSNYPFPVKENLVPCSDGAGVVVEVGSGVDSLELGDRVITNFTLTHLYGTQTDWLNALGGDIDGTLQQYVALPAQSLTKVPEECNLSFTQMASIVTTGTTAWNALFGNSPLKPGQTVLFQGTGGVSIFGLQIAKAAGAVTIITSSSDEKLKFVQEKFGADHVINYKTHPDWASVANKITHGRGVDFVLDNGGSGTIKQSIEACTRGGIVALIGFLSPAKKEDMPDVATLVMAHECIIRGISVGSQQLLRDLVRFVSAKNIQPYVQKTFGFSRDEVLEAFDYLQAGRHIGKVGIEISH